MKGLYIADEERLVLKPNMILIGLGPYAKNHYFSFFKKHQFYPKIIVDLDSKRNDIENFLQSQQLNIPIFLIPDKDKNCEVLPEDLNAMLSALVYRCERWCSRPMRFLPGMRWRRRNLRPLGKMGFLSL